MAKRPVTSLSVITPTYLKEAKQAVSKDHLEKNWYMELKDRDKPEFDEHYLKLTAAMTLHRMSALTMGQELSCLQEILKKYGDGSWTAFLRTLSFTRDTAYRYINVYKNVASRLPEPVIRVAAARNLKIGDADEKRPLGDYTEIVRKMPAPPAECDEAEANRYVTQLQQSMADFKEKVRASGSKKAVARAEDHEDDPRYDSQFLLMQAYRNGRNAIDKLKNRRAKVRWLESLVGMLMTELNYQSPQNFSPEAIPEEFQARPGRPRVVREEEEVQEVAAAS